jgi:hypothetical protein
MGSTTFGNVTPAIMTGPALPQDLKTNRADGPFAATYSNDNLPGFRRPKGACRIPSPALACHWIVRNGRLECRWQAGPGGDAPLGDFDTHGTTGRASGLSSMQALRLTMAG